MIRTNAFSTYSRNTGLTLIELLVSVAIGSVLILGLSTVTSMISNTLSVSSNKNQLSRNAQFAMDQMVRAVANSRHLLLPLADNPNTNWPEHIREQTVPATAPIGASTLATAVLAVTQSPKVDLDADGIPDADNDGDGRFDEDLNADQTNDNAPGIVLIDDDGDGEVDESTTTVQDDDEDGVQDEDWLNGIDDDGDGVIDEDSSADTNSDGDDGIDGVDDDGDGSVDEGSDGTNDDEDSQSNEDNYDAVVFYLDNGTLMLRTPVPWDESGDVSVNGLDFVTSPLAENVTHFKVERIAVGASQVKLIKLLLELTHPVSSETFQLQTQVRLGKSL